MPITNYYHKQKGVVIIIALFIVALVAAMSYALMARLEKDTERALLIQRSTQAELYAQGSLAWAIDVLKNDLIKRKENRITDPVPIQSPVNEINGYHIKSTIYDMQDRYCINNLSNSLPAVVDFKRLLNMVFKNMNDEKSKDIATAAYLWLTPGVNHSQANEYYLNLPTPYRSANRAMVHMSELRLIKGMDAVTYANLKDYVNALPQGTPINVQTATLPVLMMLHPNMTLEMAKTIEKMRQESPFFNPEIFKQKVGAAFPNLGDIDAAKYTTLSDYFLVKTEVSIENQHLMLYTLLKRVEEGNVPVYIVWQSKGSD